MTQHLERLQQQQIERLNQSARQAHEQGDPVQFRGLQGARPSTWTLYQAPFTWADCYQYRPMPDISPMAMRMAVAVQAVLVREHQLIKEDIAIMMDELLEPHVSMVHRLALQAWEVLLNTGVDQYPAPRRSLDALRAVLNQFAPISGSPWPDHHAFVPTLPPL